ncbi:F-type H+-transporting ATPase subunit delta [Breznakibacter xylanolyticus]|uniref:ATP synthase subunit delta n=1 Tax=Breznakibacter xylanolyticus TaxID=990 RepID=A0A2W7N8M3_9BACT|nr:ATP synthase F1 subunit delta [Breznakibacter xylanolyticus]MBN2744575.1 ATP synthase F1 subunit delta [Marinilabiliaceae bacterium]PZX16755.1 F-type H+-transporting ATPase subunit delta [Breznakibacter xylanolyticus]
MNNSLIAVRYAKALYGLAVDQHTADAIYLDLCMIEKMLKATPDLHIFMQNPIYKPSQKKDFLSALLVNKTNPTTINFLKVIIDQKRESLIEDIIRNFSDLYRAGKNIKCVTLIVAAPISISFQQEIKSLLEKTYRTEIELTTEIKPDLLGGFILMMDGKLMDASLLHRIQEIRKKLVG